MTKRIIGGVANADDGRTATTALVPSTGARGTAVARIGTTATGRLVTRVASRRPKPSPDDAGRTRSMRRLRAAVGLGTWFGDLARDLGLDHLLHHGRNDRDAVDVDLAIYRAHHAATVPAASPLALDLARHQGLDVDDLAMRLRPHGTSRRWICGGSIVQADIAAHYRRFTELDGLHDHDREARRAFLHGGLEVRPWNDPAGGLAVRLSAAGLEIGAQLGDLHLRTIAGVATLIVDADVPRTVRMGAVGFHVDEIFDQAVLNGRGYVIERSEDYRGYLLHKGPPWPWRVTFRADPVPWRVPWAGDRP